LNSLGETINTWRVLLTRAPGALFKNTILRNYSLEKWNSSISNMINVQTFIKTYHLRVLKSAPGAPISIFHTWILSKICYTQSCQNGPGFWANPQALYEIWNYKNMNFEKKKKTPYMKTPYMKKYHFYNTKFFKF
jgi:hypothetical protein